MSSQKRKTELQWLNLIFCAMVVFVHCASAPVSKLDRSSWQFLSVFLPHQLSVISVYGFFLLSGIKLTLPRRREPSLQEYWAGRAKNILLPYAVAVMVYYLWFVYIRKYFPFSLKDFGGYLLRGDLSAQFYFVVALAQFILLTPLFKAVTRRYSPLLLLPVALGITWFSVQNLSGLLQVLFPDAPVFVYEDRVFTTYLFYYLAGCFIGQSYEDAMALLRSNRKPVYLLSGLFTVLYLYFKVRHARGAWVPFLDQLTLLYVLCALPALLLAADRLNRPLPAWLGAVDRASYLIYLYHILFLLLYDYLTELWLPTARIGTLFLGRLLFVFLLTPLFAVGWQSGFRKLKALYSKREKQQGGSYL